MRKLSDKEQSKLNRIIEERLGPWKQVKWERSRRNRVRHVLIQLPVNCPLPCICETTSESIEVGRYVTGVEAVLDHTARHNYSTSTAIVYQNSGLVRHQRCGQVISVILFPTVDSSPTTEAYVGPSGEVRGPYSRTLPFRERKEKEKK